MWPVVLADVTGNNKDLELYQITGTADSGSTFQFATTDLLDNANGGYFPTVTAADIASSRVTFQQLSSSARLTPGYYALIAFYDADQNPVQITFDSDSYSCPFDSAFPDTYQNFQPCTATAANQAGFPCISFDSANQVCLTCFTGFALVNGSCLYNDTCPDRYYFDFGVCLPVNSSCATFDIFTGYCLTCALNDSTIDARGNCV